VIWDWAEEPVPAGWLEEVEAAGLKLAANSPEAEPFLGLLGEGERVALLSRIDELLRRRVFPSPGAHRPYPWPLV
jgi:hypothetical protein